MLPKGVIVAPQPLPFLQSFLSPQLGLERRSLPPVPAVAHSDSLPLLTTKDPRRTLFWSLLCFHNLTNPSSRVLDLVSPCFHALTNPFSRNPFIFTSIQNHRVCPPALC